MGRAGAGLEGAAVPWCRAVVRAESRPTASASVIVSPCKAQIPLLRLPRHVAELVIHIAWTGRMLSVRFAGISVTQLLITAPPIPKVIFSPVTNSLLIYVLDKSTTNP